jgi:hypothetical protein
MMEPDFRWYAFGALFVFESLIAAPILIRWCTKSALPLCRYIYPSMLLFVLSGALQSDTYPEVTFAVIFILPRSVLFATMVQCDSRMRNAMNYMLISAWTLTEVIVLMFRPVDVEYSF